MSLGLILTTHGEAHAMRTLLVPTLFVLLLSTPLHHANADLVICTADGSPSAPMGCLAPGAYYCVQRFGTGCEPFLGAPPDNGTYTSCVVQSPPWPPDHQVCQWSGGPPVGSAPVPELEEYAAAAFITAALLIGWRVRKKYRPTAV